MAKRLSRLLWSCLTYGCSPAQAYLGSRGDFSGLTGVGGGTLAVRRSIDTLKKIGDKMIGPLEFNQGKLRSNLL
jgi:hypothetical protein